MFGVFLVLLQAVGVVLLAIAGLRPGGDRWIYLLIGTLLLLGTTGLDRYLTARAAEDFQRRFDELYKKLGAQVMTVPAPERPQRPPEPIGRIQILEPVDGARVTPRYLVTGVAELPVREVRIVIHPLDTGAYWVQPLPTPGKDGRWSVLAYFGRSGDIDTGKVFEVMAVGDPDQVLEEGTVLAGWPKALQRSPAIRVTRK